MIHKQMLSLRAICTIIFLSDIFVLTILISFFLVHYMVIQHESLKFENEIQATNYTKIRNIFGINDKSNELQILFIKQFNHYDNKTYRSMLIKTQNDDPYNNLDARKGSNTYLNMFTDNDRKNTLVYDQPIPRRIKYFKRLESMYLWKIWLFLDVIRAYKIYNKVYEMLVSDEDVNYSLLYVNTKDKCVHLQHFKNRHENLIKQTVNFELDAHKIVLWILGNYRWYF
ncbi:hypothetical protein THOM_0964 [Trachipleistophora hominis]|uniref:Uncharacterized protein n=1 Tax=Trachipleistophora hominis TaxID=72359 RepID=L7JX95_TRAHO|nr:hypothetical protein THOM_0964 [Trachipleistophora hominis]